MCGKSASCSARAYIIVTTWCATRDEALATLQADLAQRLARGELVALELALLGITNLAGAYATDPTLREICAEAYRLRDAERDQA